MSALTHWAQQLAAWAIPEHILAGAEESPWVLPHSVFLQRADRQIANPTGATHAAAMAALTTPGTVLDVGAAAGSTSLPLAGRAPLTGVTAVDVDERLLAEFATRAEALGVPARVLHGRWPELCARAGTADVVLCGNVVYNVPDLAPFVSALTACAHRQVIVELSTRHPLTTLNPLWRRFHGITRPEAPTADDCVAALAELGIQATVARWSRPPGPEHANFTDLVEVTRRRLCLPATAAADVKVALLELGFDPHIPPDLGSSGRDVVTLTWSGTATARRG